MTDCVVCYSVGRGSVVGTECHKRDTEVDQEHTISSTARTMSVSKPVHVCTLQVYKPVHKFATTSSVQACSLLANYEPDHISVSKLAHCLANGRLRGRAALIARAWHVMHAKRSGKILRAS